MIIKKKFRWLSLGLLLLLLAVAIFISPSSVIAQPDENFGSGVEFKGVMNFDVEFLDTGYMPAFAKCPATASLIQVGLTEYELRLSEHGPCGNRMSIWDLTINQAGNVSGEGWAEVLSPPVEAGSMMGQWWLHTGCKTTGTTPLFPGLIGTWDGETLIADTHFEGHCEGGTMWTGPDFWMMHPVRAAEIEKDPNHVLADGVTWEDGPVHVRFGAELTVVE